MTLLNFKLLNIDFAYIATIFVRAHLLTWSKVHFMY